MEQLLSSFETCCKEFETKLQKFKDSYATIKEQVQIDLQNEKQQLEQAKLDWHSHHIKLASSHTPPQEQVLLDIGGVHYSTSLQTLTNYPQSMLGAMFSGRHTIIKNDQGRYFLDRDGKLFAYVLEFLRDGEVTYDDTDSLLKTRLLKEAKYFVLEEMENWLLRDQSPPMEESLNNSLKEVVLSPYVGMNSWCLEEHQPHQFLKIFGSQKLTVKHAGPQNNFGYVIGSVGLKTGVHQWKVRIDQIADCFWIGFGIVDKAKLSPYFNVLQDSWCGCSSNNQFFQMNAALGYWKEGDEFICSLDMRRHIFCIRGPKTEVWCKFGKGLTLYPVFHLINPGNQISICIVEYKQST